MLDENVSSLIIDLYAGVGDSVRWEAVMSRLNARLNVSWSMLGLVTENSHRPVDVLYTGISTSRAADGMREYYDGELYNKDPVNLFASTKRSGVFDSREIGSEDYLDDPYVRWNEDRMGSTYWRFAQSGSEGLRLGLSLHRTSEYGPFEPNEARLFDMLFSHVENAVRLQAQPSLPISNDAIVLLDGRGRVVTANEPAYRLIASKTAVMVVDGTLRALDRTASVTFSKAVRSAVTAVLEGGCGCAVKLPRIHDRALLAVVKPIFPVPVIMPSVAARVQVRFVELIPPLLRDQAAQWGPLFGLTRAETRLVEALLNHDENLRKTAERLAIAYATARNQLANVFEKTGVHSQSQLSRLITRITD